MDWGWLETVAINMGTKVGRVQPRRKQRCTNGGSIPPVSTMNNQICKCGEELHPVRIKYGYNTCVPCSTVERYGCAPVINHKTGNSIQVLSRADAKRIAKLTRRKGYGTMLR
tara:strand:- start:438 stop:773 length:336 start_codon:yes stop_codon:yes gene_type:complete